MRVSYWDDYELIDTSGGERLERWGDVILIRPDPQIIWETYKQDRRWLQSNARYHRSSSGGGRWEIYDSVPDSWKICYKNLVFNVKTMGFKHTGVFPEQAVNWDLLIEKIKESEKPFKVLNLFAYTGGATMACASAGAEVCHVDSSKGMVSWARENARCSGLGSKPIRWIVDDCIKFVQREQRRGNRYDGIIMDPPSYGRGPDGEVWKLEDKLFYLIEMCREIMKENASFFIINSYTKGLSPSIMGYMLEAVIKSKFGGRVISDEIGLCVKSNGLILPSGAVSMWENI